jgi:hypothetical protein
MRYSRFKKQMDGTAGVRRPRNPNSPRKKKAEKAASSKTPKKIKERPASDNDSDNDKAKIKFEGPSSSSSSTGGGGSGYDTVEGTPETGSVASPGLIKREPVAASSDAGSLYTSTPGFGTRADELEHMMTGFGMAGHEHLYAGVLSDAQQQFGMEIPMGMHDPFGGMWQPAQTHTEGRVLVKTEPRWEETYRQVQVRTSTPSSTL